jgi:hypothetical protein
MRSTGSDVRITNTVTGAVQEVQLKATNYLSYIKHHNARFADIPVFATEEIAGAHDEIGSTGIAYQDLDGAVDSVVSGLEDVDDPGVLESMSVSAMVSLARNVKVLLKGNRMSALDRSRLMKDGVRSALVAGLVHSVIG